MEFSGCYSRDGDIVFPSLWGYLKRPSPRNNSPVQKRILTISISAQQTTENSCFVLDLYFPPCYPITFASLFVVLLKMHNMTTCADIFLICAAVRAIAQIRVAFWRVAEHHTLSAASNISPISQLHMADGHLRKLVTSFVRCTCHPSLFWVFFIIEADEAPWAKITRRNGQETHLLK